MFYGSILGPKGWSLDRFQALYKAAKGVLTCKEANDPLNDLERAVAEILQEPMHKLWLKSHGLKESRAHGCVRTLLKGRVSKECDRGCLLPPGNDHGKLWNRDGKPVCYTFEPYYLGTDKLKSLSAFCEEHGLDVAISGSSWHFVGWTVLVELWKKGEPWGRRYR
jgi:hypothetical protein